MAIGVSLVEEDVSVTPVVEKIGVAVAEPSVSVSIVDERIDLSVTEEIVQVTAYNDKIGVSVLEQPVTIVIAESNTELIAAEEELYDIEVDTSVAGVTYVGQAMPGTAKATAAWRIKKITDSAGGASVDWADGTAAFIHVWDNHLSLTYGP